MTVHERLPQHLQSGQSWDILARTSMFCLVAVVHVSSTMAPSSLGMRIQHGQHGIIVF